MVLNLLDLQEVSKEHAMIPKNDVEGIDIDDTKKNINEKINKYQSNTRIPIYSKNLSGLKDS